MVEKPVTTSMRIWTVDCPYCQQPPGHKCIIPGTTLTYPFGAHLERYQRVGLIPPKASDTIKEK